MVLAQEYSCGSMMEEMENRKKDPAAVSMAKKRAASMTPERRVEIAKKAIATRWANAKKKKAKGKLKAGA